MSAPITNRAPWMGIAMRAGAFVLALLLASLVITTHERRVTGGFDEPVTVRVSGVARLIVPTEPPTDPDVDPTRWVVQSGSSIIPLEDEEAAGLVPGQTVRASYTEGEGLDNVVRTRGVARPYAPVADRRVLVVPVQWADRPMSDTRLAAATKTQEELTAWWGPASSGAEAVTMRQTPVLNVTPAEVCDDYGVRTQVLDWVKTSAFAGWPTNTALLWPENSGCWYGGLGEMPGSFTWMNHTHPGIWAHELGHNMGLPHASSCAWETPGPKYPVLTPTVPSYLTKCRTIEYGNRYDLMGGGNNLGEGFNVQYLEKIGWLNPAQVSTWNGTNSTFQLSLFNNSSATTRAVKIPAPTLVGSDNTDNFWLQFRPKGTSNWPDEQAGVIVMMQPSWDYNRNMKFTAREMSSTFLCPISTTSEIWDAKYFLVPGVPFDDRLGRFRITLVSLDTSVATVKVEPGPARAMVPAFDVNATVLTDDSGTPTGSVTVGWSAASSSDAALAEPSAWTASLSPGGPTCTVAVYARSCTITKVPRNLAFNVAVTGTGPPGSAATAGPAVAPIPPTPPTVDADHTLDETEVEIRARIDDDGGTPVTSFTVTRENGPSCDATASVCRFTDLPANFTTNFVVQATNGAGQRSKVLQITTERRFPDRPVGSYVTKGATDTITIDAHPLDRWNTTHLLLECEGPQRTNPGRAWQLEKEFEYTGNPVVVTRDNKVGAIRGCSASATVRADDAWDGYAMISGWSRLKAGQTPLVDPGDGTVTTVPVPNPITLSVKATRFERGRYVVRWTAKSRDGKTVRVTVPKFGSRKCVYRTRTSCVVVGLRPGKTYSVVFVGKTSTATKKVTFSIKAR